MTMDPTDATLRRLAPAVLERHDETYSVASDIGALARVWRAQAPEGTIFYAARILEALTGDAIVAYGLQRTHNAFANLVLLEDLGAFRLATRYWAHALRRLGNQARHLHRRLDVDDAALALLLAEQVLAWFFCRFEHGPRLPSVVRDEGNALPVPDAALFELFVRIDAARDATEFGGRLEDEAAFFATAILPSVVAERFLEAGLEQRAESVLDAALDRFPDDLRLLQLRGLVYSRQMRLDRALDVVRPLKKRFGPDEETIGILGGIYKRQWQEAGHDPAALRRAEKAYADGWARSRATNTYLGQNAATTALWLGAEERARQRAREVVRVLRKRWRTLQSRGGDPVRILSFWNVVTLAEAYLLLRRPQVACKLYRRAFDEYASKPRNIDVARGQASELWTRLGLGGTFEKAVSP